MYVVLLQQVMLDTSESRMQSGGFSPLFMESLMPRMKQVTTFLNKYLLNCLEVLVSLAEVKNTTDVWSLETSKQGYEF